VLGTPGAAHHDDLKVINGIGPYMEKTLNGFEVKSWEQLAALKKADVEKVSEAIGAFPGRIERDGWVRQARDLVRRFPLRSPYDRPTRKTFLNESLG
jgi:NADH-quinone oxidoreductase subunit E